MADITLKLILYKLREVYKNTGTRYERFLEWYEDFSLGRVDILDMLFLGWLLAAFLVVAAINLYLRFFGLPKSRRKEIQDGTGMGPSAIPNLVHGGETCQWLNSTLAWIFLHYNHTPEFVDTWLRALNEQARKHAEQVQLKFDRVQAGSLPPKLTKVSADASSKDTLTVHATVETSDIVLLVSAIQQHTTNIKVSNCDVSIQKLQGQLRIHSLHSHDEVQATISFVARPNLTLLVKSKNYDSDVDTKSIETIVRDAISNAVTHVILPSRGGYPAFYSTNRAELGNSTLFTPAGQAKSLKDKRLLVKVIKANGLGDKEFGCSNAYCIVQMDEPPQRHTTSVVKNTVNPFWDEHFLFDLDDNTHQVTFEVFDREKPPGDDFLGRAVIPMSDLRRMPSSRQIIPLTSKPGSTTTTSGSVTIEFLFMEPAEAQAMKLNGGATITGDSSLSPRRRIETSQSVRPGGTIVTTTTTTTEKPKDHRLDASYHESPSVIEKAGQGPYGTQEYSPYNSSGRSSHLSAHDAALTASQAATLPRSFGSPKLTVTTASQGKLSGTSDGTSPEESMRDTYSLSTAASHEPRAEVKKKSFASAIKKRFTRSKKPRSQSADRARSSSYREGSLLKPPEQVEHGSRTADDLEHAEFPESGLRKSRSHSFSSSLKRIFKKKKKDSVSRESSISRTSNRAEYYDTSREGSVANPSPHISGDRMSNLRQPSPVGDYHYSTSVPARHAPIHDH